MAVMDWGFPADAQGLKDLVAQLAQVRSEGNEAEVCRGLLRQAFVVKWAGSDTDAEPFTRSRNWPKRRTRSPCGRKISSANSLRSN